jgi:putative ABC transport system permease protein
MTGLWTVALRSAWHRRTALALVLLSVALSSFLLLAVERVRQDMRQSFASAVSGTDLLVGARGGQVPLLLYGVFRLGQPVAPMRWRSVEAIAADPAVAWVVPLSLGDSLRGFPVLGTTSAYFRHFRHGDGQALRLAQGEAFRDRFEAVLGAEVAERLTLRVGDRVVLSHGGGEIVENEHDEHPFRVSGVLARTGTPVDRTVHVSLAGLSALHEDGGVPGLPGLAGLPRPPGFGPPPGPATDPAAPAAPASPLLAGEPAGASPPREVTALLVGLHERAAVFSVQRRVNESRTEPLMAVLPGVALDELWDAVDLGEGALRLLSALVAVVSLAGLVAVILAGLETRRRELAVLRAVGASPRHVLALLLLEGALLSTLGTVAGALAGVATVALAGPAIAARWGLVLSTGAPDAASLALAGAVIAGGTLASLLPGWRAYRMSLSDGLMPRA